MAAASPIGVGHDNKSELEHQLDQMDTSSSPASRGLSHMKLHTDSDSDDELHGRIDINRHLMFPEWDGPISPSSAASTPSSNNPPPKGHYRDRSQTSAGTGLHGFGRAPLVSISTPSTPVGAQKGAIIGSSPFGSPAGRSTGGLVSQHLGAFQAREQTSTMLPKGIVVQPRPTAATVHAVAARPTIPSNMFSAPHAPHTTTNAAASAAAAAGKSTSIGGSATTSDLSVPVVAAERKRRYSAPKADIGGLLGFWKTQEKKKIDPTPAAAAAPPLARQPSGSAASGPSKWELQKKEREAKEKEMKEKQNKEQMELDKKRREAAASVSAKMAANAAKKSSDASTASTATTNTTATTPTVAVVVTPVAATATSPALTPAQRAIAAAEALAAKRREEDRVEASRKADREAKLQKQREEDEARVKKEAADREARIKAEEDRRAAAEAAEKAKREEAERERLAKEKQAKDAAEAAAAAERARIAAEEEETRRREEQEKRERELAAHIAELKRLEEIAAEEEKARLRAQQAEKEAAAARAREEEAKAIAVAAAERERLRVQAELQKQKQQEAEALAKKAAEEEAARAEKARLEAEAQRLESERIEVMKREEEERLAAERVAQKQIEEEEELARNKERERLAAEAAAAAAAHAAAHPEPPASPNSTSQMSPPATPLGSDPIRGSFSLDGIFCGDESSATSPASSPPPYTAPAPQTIGGTPDHNSSLSALAALPTVRMIGRNSVGGRERSPSNGGLPLPVSPAAMYSLSEGRVTRESIAAANTGDISSPPPLGRGPSASVAPLAQPAVPLTPEEEEKQKKKAEADVIQRAKVRGEITSTEQTYVKSLGILVDQFIHPLKSSDAYDVSQKDVSLMFSNVELLYNFHRVFLKEITVVEAVGDVLLKYADFLKMYTQYLNGYPRSLQCINDNRGNKKFQAFLADKRKACGLDLMSYLIMPVQRIPRYELLLREMKRLTPASHPEYPRLCDAFDKIQNIGSHINEEQRQVENMSKLLEIQNRISGEFGTLMQPHRRLVREGQLTKVNPGLVTSTNARLLFLFSDIIVYTTTSHKFRGHCELAKSTIIEHSDKKKHGFEIKYGEKSMIWLCQSEKEKQEWMGEIMGAMAAIKEGIEQQMKRRHATRVNKAKTRGGRVDAAHMRQARSHSLLTPEDTAGGPGTGLSAPPSPSHLAGTPSPQSSPLSGAH